MGGAQPNYVGAGALTRRRSEAPQIGLYARPGELRPPGRGRPGLRQHRRKRLPVRQRPCPFKTQRVRAALRFFHQQNFFHSVCLRELYLDYLIHGGGDGAAHEISRDRQLAMTAVNQHA